MKIDIVTLFPEMFAALDASITGRALKAGLLELRLHALRDFAINRHGQVDDSPFGGEAGMVLRPEPLQAAIEKVFGLETPPGNSETGPGLSAPPEGAAAADPTLPPAGPTPPAAAADLSAAPAPKPHVISLTPQGRLFDQDRAKALAQKPHLLLLCGHYKGMDERITDLYVDEELSIGDYVLTGGELPAMVLVDAVARLLPGALHDRQSLETDSFYEPHRLGWPVYTRPALFEGLPVPEVLLSGHHEKIRQWRVGQSLRRTREVRPDLFARLSLTKEEARLLDREA